MSTRLNGLISSRAGDRLASVRAVSSTSIATPIATSMASTIGDPVKKDDTIKKMIVARSKAASAK